MMHLNDGQLRALLDHENDLVRAPIELHLATCAECRGRVAELRARAERIAAQFDTLTPNSAVSPQAALARFQNRYARKEISLMQKIFQPRYRPAWAMLALVALVALALTFEPVRVLAEGLLAQFRVAKISVVSVDGTRLNDLAGSTEIGKQITQLLSDSTQVIQQPGKPQAVANATQASALAKFTVRLPASRTDAPQLTVQGNSAFQFTINRARAQALLDQLGTTQIKLPASLDGALIKVTIPSAVAAGYGDCPKLDATQDKTAPAANRQSSSRTVFNCIILTQIPSPTVDTPPNLDVQQLAELGLQFTGMTKDQAHAYAQTVDWTSTLVVPIPRNAAQYKQVTVDGVQGYLIQRPLDDAPQYALVWVKGGIIYAIGGTGADTATALDMANALK